MLNVQRTANAFEPRVRHSTTDQCNVQSSKSSPYISLNKTFNMLNTQCSQYVQHAQYAMFSKRTWSLSGAGRARISSQTNAPIAGSSSSLISVGTKLCRITKWSLGIIHSFAQKGLHQEHLRQACYSVDIILASLPRASRLGNLTS